MTDGPSSAYTIDSGSDWTFDFFGNALGDNVWIKGSGSHDLRLGDKIQFTADTESGTSQSGGSSGSNGNAKIKLESSCHLLGGVNLASRNLLNLLMFSPYNISPTLIYKYFIFRLTIT